MKKQFLKSIFFAYAFFISFYLANQAFARTNQSWSAVGSGMNDYVNDLVIYNNELYAGGTFTTADGSAAAYIAKWNGTNWSKVGTTGMNSDVNSLVVYNNELYAGGRFVTVDGATINRVAKWNGNTWSAVGSSGMDQYVSSLVVYNNELYAGGFFTTADGNAANYMAKWNGTKWSQVGTGMNSWINDLIVYNNELYAAGNFTTADGNTANHIAKWNGTNWSQAGITGINGSTTTLGIYNNELYAGGVFTLADNISVNNIAKWNGTSWNQVSSGTNSSVNSLETYNNELYVGGNFTTAGGVAANRIAKWNGLSWSAIGSGANGIPYAFLVNNNELYVGGNFTTIGDISANYIVSWFEDTIAPVTTATPAGGTYTSTQTITLAVSDSSPTYTTYYTTDGSTPTTSSSTYSSPITISHDTVLKFYTIDAAGNVESVKTETYLLDQALAEKKLKKRQKITLYSGLDEEQISGQSLVINFSNLPNKLTKNNKYWIQLIKHSSYPGNLELGSHFSLKKYWLFKTNLNKYKPKKNSQKFKIKIAFKYTKKELNVLKKINPSIAAKDLILKYRVKAGTSWYPISDNWSAKITHKISKKKYIVKYFKKFPQNNYYFAIIKK